jgi:predicted acyltransferase
VPTGGFALLATFLGEALLEGRRGRTLALGLLGLFLGLLGLFLLPPDKTYWTPTYLLLALGVGAFLLLLLEGLPPWAQAPLRPLGANPLLAYVLPLALKLTLLKAPLEALLALLTARYGPLGGWAWTAGYILGWWLVFFWLYRLRFFFRL